MKKKSLFQLFSGAVLAGIILFSVACKKKEPEPVEELTPGCLDNNAVNYNGAADYEDQSCQYAYVDAYKITYHPEKDEDGDDWDLFINTDADLVLRVKEEGGTNWLFESAEITNHEHNVVATWTAPTNIQLYNRNYEWELVDYDSGSADDFVGGGTFNPIDLVDNGIISTTIGDKKKSTTTKICKKRLKINTAKGLRLFVYFIS